MTHPLTDEILRDILEAVAKETEEDSSGWFEDDLMRAAADWQLEQVSKHPNQRADNKMSWSSNLTFNNVVSQWVCHNWCSLLM